MVEKEQSILILTKSIAVVIMLLNLVFVNVVTNQTYYIFTIFTIYAIWYHVFVYIFSFVYLLFFCEDELTPTIDDEAEEVPSKEDYSKLPLSRRYHVALDDQRAEHIEGEPTDWVTWVFFM